jgi:hypothetical protein
MTPAFAIARRRSAEPVAERSVKPAAAAEAGEDQALFLKRQLSLAVSWISQR